MKPRGRRKKGSGFEREIAAEIVKAFRKYGITKKDCFRTPLSGGHRMVSEEDPGDLMFSRKLRDYFPFVVECKRAEEFHIETFLMPPGRDTGHGAWSYLRQALRQAEHLERPALLICRKNHGTAVVIFPTEWNPFKIDARNREGLRFTYADLEWTILPWNHFLKGWLRDRSWENFDKVA